MHYKQIKRILDFFGALVLLVLLSPLFLVIAILVKIDSKGPAIYKQKRFRGLNETFYVYKFRTMKEGARRVMMERGVSEKKLITRVGKILRETHSDELPQLYNILKGEMSLVGIRPQQPSEHEWIKNSHGGWVKRYKASMGGISIERLISIDPRIHQSIVSNLKNASYLKNERLRASYDLYYVDNENFWNDTVIFIYTIRVVLAKIFDTLFRRKFVQYDNCDKKRKNRYLY
jgi:lipopolysaccharide/colanic/teichoic acid biosynthesis glycosyltransferase